eukprot:4516426-Heterocapsa_arctica.AAC.1
MYAHWNDIQITPTLTFPGNTPSAPPAQSSRGTASASYTPTSQSASPWPRRADPVAPTPWKEDGPVSQGQRYAKEAADASYGEDPF